MFKLTDSAIAELRRILAKAEPNRRCVSIGAFLDRGVEERFELDTVGTADCSEPIVVSGITFTLNAAARQLLEGATVAFVQTMWSQGFTFEVRDASELCHDRHMARKVKTYMDEKVAPLLAKHGGGIRLRDVKEGVAFVSLHGGCQGCGLAPMTVRGILAQMKRDLQAVKDIVDITEHAAGATPYA